MVVCWNVLAVLSFLISSSLQLLYVKYYYQSNKHSFYAQLCKMGVGKARHFYYSQQIGQLRRYEVGFGVDLIFAMLFAFDGMVSTITYLK